jgi:8-oxo-dGTP pyrophosphatase MutT (NUDIX family)
MIDLDALRERLRGRERLTLRLDGFRESAVLLPIVVEPGQPERLILTVRQGDLPTHAGQISFPGGKRDPGDPDLMATAIRETAEELGIEPAAVEVLGLLDDVPTPVGFVITPVVARVRGPITLRPSTREVAEVLVCELEALARPSIYVHQGTREYLGVVYTLHEYHWHQHRIWGATARMVHQLLATLAA